MMNSCLGVFLLKFIISLASFKKVLSLMHLGLILIVL